MGIQTESGLNNLMRITVTLYDELVADRQVLRGAGLMALGGLAVAAPFLPLLALAALTMATIIAVAVVGGVLHARQMRAAG